MSVFTIRAKDEQENVLTVLLPLGNDRVLCANRRNELVIMDANDLEERFKLKFVARNG